MADFARDWGEDQWETIVSGAWLQGHLGAIGWHIPKNYPESPAALLKKAEPKKPMQARDWEAFIFGVTGRRIKVPDSPPEK